MRGTIERLTEEEQAKVPIYVPISLVSLLTLPFSTKRNIPSSYTSGGISRAVAALGRKSKTRFGVYERERERERVRHSVRGGTFPL